MHVSIHDDLDGSALDRPPIAPRIGPFAGREFLATTARFTGSRIDVIESVDAALLVERTEDGVRLAGDSDLTDYHSPLGTTVAAVTDLVTVWASGLPSGTRLDLDSLPVEAADPIEDGLRAAGVATQRTRHEITAVLDLPATFDGYLASLSKKQRHETRRKLRRFEEGVGAPRLVRETGTDVVDMFCDLHGRSGGRKGGFMTVEMRAHFATLVKDAGAVIDVLYGDGDRPTAAAFGFDDADTTYLYNSAYEPDLAEASPGIVLVAKLIEDAIDRNHTRFDFLKGDETYKFRMGASERPLFRLTGATP